MAKLKFYYDTDTCNYERIRVSKTEVLFNFMGFFIIILIFAAGIIFVLSLFNDSPKLVDLKKENETLTLIYQDTQQDLKLMEQKLSVLAERDDRVYRVIFETDPIPPNIRKGGVGGTNRYPDIKDTQEAHKELMLGAYQKIDLLKHEMYIQTKSYDLINELAKNKEDMLASIPAIQPISIDDLTRLYKVFGMRMHPLLNFERKHEGLDFSAPRGTPIYATGDGRVESAFFSLSAGNFVVINHGYSYKTRYLHMSKFAVTKGQKVKRGDIIGYVGSTGLSGGPHCHYEVLKNGDPENPVHYFNQGITQEEFELIVEMSAGQNDFD